MDVHRDSMVFKRSQQLKRQSELGSYPIESPYGHRILQPGDLLAQRSLLSCESCSWVSEGKASFCIGRETEAEWSSSWRLLCR